MKHTRLLINLSVALGFALLWHVESGAQITLATGADAQVTADGLHRVDPSQIDDPAWVSEDLDLSRYNRVYFMPTAVVFRDVPERNVSVRTMDANDVFFVNEVRKTRLAETFGESFREAAEVIVSFEVSEDVGRDVLMIGGLLTDVTSGVPPEIRGASSQSSVGWAWEANIIMELRDSMSDDVLARTVNRERIEGPFDVAEVGPLTSRISTEWSRLLMRRLEELRGLSSE